MSQCCPFPPFHPPLHPSYLPCSLFSTFLPSLYQPPPQSTLLSSSASSLSLSAFCLYHDPILFTCSSLNDKPGDSFRLLKAKARCVQIYLALCLSALLPLIQYVFFEPPRASLCLKLRVMALFTPRKDHTERKGLAVACFAFYYFIFHVKTLTNSVFSSILAAISAFDPLLFDTK